MNIIFLIFITLSFTEMHTGNNLYIEKGSERIFTVETKYDLDKIEIKIRSGKFVYTENLVRKGDTLFMMNRNMGYGMFSGSSFYDPPRPRIIFPVINQDTLHYSGIESITGLKRKIESYVFSVSDSNNTSIIKNITIRGEHTDEYEIHIDSTGFIKYIVMELPAFSFLYKFIGFKNNKLEFIPYEEY